MPTIADISELLIELGLSASVSETDRALAQQSLIKAEGAVKRCLLYDPVQASRTEYYPNQDFTRTGREAIWEANDTHAYLRHLAEASTIELQVRHLPIRSITSLHIDYDGRAGTRSGAFGSETAKTEGTDFWPNYDSLDSDGNKVCTDGILRSEGLWPATAGSVKIVYTAGYTQAELRGAESVLDASPIWEAVLDEAVRRFTKAKQRMTRGRAGFTGPLTSESLGDYSYSADSAMLTRLVGGGMDVLPETEQKLSSFINYGVAMAS